MPEGRAPETLASDLAVALHWYPGCVKPTTLAMLWLLSIQYCGCGSSGCVLHAKPHVESCLSFLAVMGVLHQRKRSCLQHPYAELHARLI